MDIVKQALRKYEYADSQLVVDLLSARFHRSSADIGDVRFLEERNFFQQWLAEAFQHVNNNDCTVVCRIYEADDNVYKLMFLHCIGFHALEALINLEFDGRSQRFDFHCSQLQLLLDRLEPLADVNLAFWKQDLTLAVYGLLLKEMMHRVFDQSMFRPCQIILYWGFADALAEVGRVKDSRWKVTYCA